MHSDFNIVPQNHEGVQKLCDQINQRRPLNTFAKVLKACIQNLALNLFSNVKLASRSWKDLSDLLPA